MHDVPRGRSALYAACFATLVLGAAAAGRPLPVDETVRCRAMDTPCTAVGWASRRPSPGMFSSGPVSVGLWVSNPSTAPGLGRGAGVLAFALRFRSMLPPCC